jgi:hypothetical protein
MTQNEVNLALLAPFEFRAQAKIIPAQPPSLRPYINITIFGFLASQSQSLRAKMFEPFLFNWVSFDARTKNKDSLSNYQNFLLIFQATY